MQRPESATRRASQVACIRLTQGFQCVTLHAHRDRCILFEHEWEAQADSQGKALMLPAYQ